MDRKRCKNEWNSEDGRNEKKSGMELKFTGVSHFSLQFFSSLNSLSIPLTALSMASSGAGGCRFTALAMLAVTIAGMFVCGHSYRRPKARRMIFVHHRSGHSGDNSPQQVRLRSRITLWKRKIHTLRSLRTVSFTSSGFKRFTLKETSQIMRSNCWDGSDSYCRPIPFRRGAWIRAHGRVLLFHRGHMGFVSAPEMATLVVHVKWTVQRSLTWPSCPQPRKLLGSWKVETCCMSLVLYPEKDYSFSKS